MRLIGRATMGGVGVVAMVLTALGVAPALAADDEKLEEIVVTSEKREESLQKVPVSVTALSGDYLNQIGANELNDYFKYVPGINYAPAATGDCVRPGR